MAFVSIQLNSNRPQQVSIFFDSIEDTADNPSDIEVLLHIDVGDTVMEEAMAAEQQKRRFILRLLQTDLVKGYATLWKPLNPLFKMTDPNAYFVINLSDEMLFKTKGWDSVIRNYIGYYPDHIFRLRASQYRFRNYTDFWECGYAPDSIAFYTRRWLELSGDWNPCLGPDSFQQCVAFYLFTSDSYSQTQYNRDIALTELSFSGEGAGIGLEGIAKYQRIIINNRAWFVLMSHRMQEEAKRRAMRMKSHIIADYHGGKAKIRVEEVPGQKHFRINSIDHNTLIANLPYGLSFLCLTLTNWARSLLLLHYAGGGKEAQKYKFFSILVMIATFAPSGARLLTGFTEARKTYWSWRSKIKHPLRHLRDRTHEHIHKCKKAINLTLRAWTLLRNDIYGPTTANISCAEKNHLAITIGFRKIVWIIASSFYSLMLSLRRVFPIKLRNAMISLMPWKRLKDHFKCWAQVNPDLYSNTSHRFALLVLLMGKTLLRLLFFPFLVIIDSAIFLMLRPALKVRQILKLRKLKHIQQHLGLYTKVDFSSMPEQLPVSNTSSGTVLFSILLRGNRPLQIVSLLDNIENSADNPSRIEVLIPANTNDTALESLLKSEQKRRKLKLRYLGINFSEFKNSSNSLLKLADPSAYFVALLGDEARFETKGWDTMLMGYARYYPDHIFRIRGSKYRFHNYTGFQESCLVPDGFTFYTKQWLSIQGDFGPSSNVDSFQQCVSYYLFTSDPFSHRHYQRDIAAPFILFTGEQVISGPEEQAREPDILFDNANQSGLMSHSVQEEAKRRAIYLKSCILCHAQLKQHADAPAVILHNALAKMLIIQNHAGIPLEELPYGISPAQIKFAIITHNLYRKYNYIVRTREKHGLLKCAIMIGRNILPLKSAARLPHHSET